MDASELQLEKEIMKRDKQIKLSQAKQIDVIFEKHKKMMGYFKSLADFQEPVLLLMRKNGTTEFFENATQGLFKFESSDADKQEEEEIELHPKYQTRFSYGNGTFKGYICQEGIRYPLPQEPIIYAENIKMFMGKLMTDYIKYLTQLENTKNEKIYKWLVGVAIVVGAVALAYSVAPGLFEMLGNAGKKKAAEEVVTPAVNNTIRIIQNSVLSFALFKPWRECRNKDCKYMKMFSCNADKCIYDKEPIVKAIEPEIDGPGD